MGGGGSLIGSRQTPAGPAANIQDRSWIHCPPLPFPGTMWSIAMASFDLITEDWIPVVTLAGPARDVGLRELVVEAHTLRDLASASPLENVAILCLVLAIIY